MLLWTLIALLTAAAILAVLVPLARTPRGAAPDVHARQVYRDQLDELDRDKASGRISADDAEAARAEIARRLLSLGGEPEAGAADGGRIAAGSLVARRSVAVLALAGIPALSLSLYFALGTPSLPGAPLAARLDAQPSPASDIEVLVARAEKHLAESPEDGRGWEILAPVYMRMGRPVDSVRAYRNVIRILGSTPERQTSLGHAIWIAERGIVTEEARSAFQAANALDPTAPQPRFFLALAAQQQGDSDDARKRLTALLADMAAGDPWRETVEAALAGLDGVAQQPGPSSEDIAAAGEMSADERTAMIEGMVSGLAARLQTEPNDADGWLRLIRSYVVLGKIDEAAEAARAALAGVTDTGGRRRVEALIADLGVKPAEAATP